MANAAAKKAAAGKKYCRYVLSVIYIMMD
jgi:hypothetical protein